MLKELLSIHELNTITEGADTEIFPIVIFFSL